MSLSIVPNDNLEWGKPARSGAVLWDSTGEDPAFKVAYGYFRHRYVVITLSGIEGELDPRIYANRGYGFREENSTPLGEGTHFAIIADVGAFGTICSFRFDPASFATRFSMDVKTFRTAPEANAHADGFLTVRGEGRKVDAGKMPRFWMKPPRLSFGRSRYNVLDRYAAASYRLGERLALAPVPPGGPKWLSIIVPVYNAPARYLDDLLTSFETQDNAGTELILSDDGSTSDETRLWYERHKQSERVKFQMNERNGGIAAATNAGLLRATGDRVALLDHDDVIAPHALKVIRQALEGRPDAIFLYTDELIVNDHLRPAGAMLKPAYDPVLLSGVNYINHFSIYKRSRLEEIGYIRTGYDGSQDYDLLLRYLDGVTEEAVLHLPYPAYWWRQTGKTYSQTFKAKSIGNARKALGERFSRERTKAEAGPANTQSLHRLTFEQTGEDGAAVWPKISVIIPSRNAHDLVARILGDLFERTDYPDFEVVIADNGTTDEAVLALYDDYRARYPNFAVHIETEEFNFSRAVNKGIARATGEHFLLLNNDIEIIDAGWMKEMVSCLQYEKTGIVGAKLLYPGDRIQHAGVIAGFGGLAGHWYLNKPASFGGPMNRLHVRNSLTCVTGAAMLVSGECARTVGAWDETNFAIAYNDVDYCLRAHKAGFRIVWTPFACLYHHESVSRGSDATGENSKRFEKEKENLRRVHATASFIDPAINPAYSRDRSDPRLVVPDELSPARSWRSGATPQLK